MTPSGEGGAPERFHAAVSRCLGLHFELEKLDFLGEVLRRRAAAEGCRPEALLQHVREAGGFTIAQDEATCVVSGMAREAVLLGALECVLPLDAIGPALAGLVRPQGGAK